MVHVPRERLRKENGVGHPFQPRFCRPTRRPARGIRRLGHYERELFSSLLEGFANLTSIRVYGITDPDRFGERVPTVSFTHSRKTPQEIAEYLGERGIFVWHGNYYALPVAKALGLEPDGMVRVGLLHYNTHEEVDRLLAALAELGSVVIYGREASKRTCLKAALQIQ